jgi:23S rRNA (guanosine2251-2'-O)-methyltransferase
MKKYEENMKSMKRKSDIRLLLDNIRSVHNAGSIFRTADGAGVSKIYCVGTTPVPVDRFGRKRADFAKVALGAEDMIEWEHMEESAISNLIKKLKKEGFKIVALEQSADSIDYKKVKLGSKNGSKGLIILGNEVGGVSTVLLESADVIAEIPMRGRKESLNVSVAAGIVLFQML